MADGYTLLSQEVLDISMAQAESIVEPNCLTHDFGWESVAFVGIHPPISAISAQLICQYPGEGSLSNLLSYSL
jgi:hypothetical protein